MSKRDYIKRILTVFLSLVMTVTYMPAAVFAEPISEKSASQTEASNDIAAPSGGDAAAVKDASRR